MIREIVDTYNRHWIQILIWSIAIIFPITTICYLGVFYVLSSNDVLIPQYFAGLAIFLNFILCIPPFMKMVMLDERDETITPMEGIQFFLKQFGLLLLFTLLFYLFGILGLYLFFIPTIIAMFFLLIFPFVSESRTVKEVIVKTFKVMVKENISLIGDAIVIFSVNIGIWAIIMMFFEQYDNNVFAFLLIRNILNILIFPIIYIYLTFRYRKEEIEQSMAEGWS